MTSLKKSIVVLDCLFTTQLTKKRKSWTDGKLKVLHDGPLAHGILLNQDGIKEIVARPLEKYEIAKLNNKETINLEFENYLIDVQYDIADEKILSTLPKFPKKFVPPSSIVPKSKAAHVEVDSTPLIRQQAQKLQAAAYPVTSDELDNIWGVTGSSQNNNTSNDPRSLNDALNCSSTSAKIDASGTSRGVAPFGHKRFASNVASASDRISDALSGKYTSSVTKVPEQCVSAPEIITPQIIVAAISNGASDPQSRVFVARTISNSIWDEV
jgi:hypothetical protein